MARFYANKFPFIGESVELLRRLKGQRIVGFSRLFDWNPVKFLRDFPKVREDQLFQFGSGPIFLSVESGLCVGFSNWEKERSVMVWKEVLPLTLEEASKKCFMFDEGFFIDCTDNRFSNSYWSELIGRHIERLAILTVENGPDPRRYRNERGLLIVTDDGKEWLIAYGLSESGHAGFLLMQRDDIRKDYLNRFTLLDI